MRETEPKPISIHPRPEDIFTTQEAEIQRLADRGELPCPQCGESLVAEKIASGEYEGLVLTCLNGCGWQEV
jgi:predicted RNA-binding Zn-ribbon protein involved in translation (DUF1610 family)